MAKPKPIKRTRMEPGERTTQMLNFAVAIAEKDGLNALTRRVVAEAAGVTKAMVNLRFGGIDALRGAVCMQFAATENMPALQRAFDDGYDVLALPLAPKAHRALSLYCAERG